VRKLEKSRPDLPRVGYAKHPKEENIRFGQVPYLHFPTSEIADVTEGKGDVDASVMVYFFGLLGVNGPMPLEFTNYILQRSRNYYDHTWRRFADIIHHRMLSLFYRAFAVNEQSVCFDRSDDRFSEIIKSLAGFSPDFAYGPVSESLILRYADRFGNTVKSKAALEYILCSLLKLKVKIKDFVFASYDIPEDCRAKLGDRKTASLGVNSQIGLTYISASKKFEIGIGPVDFEVCGELMPGTYRFAVLTRVLQLYLDKAFDYDIRFTLISATIPRALLGFPSARLGYACWTGKIRGGQVQLLVGASRINLKGISL
jgi:type VI secretion system protein ImpH